MLNMRFAFPDCLIDINRVAELAYLRESDGGIEIGAMTRQRDVEFSPLVARRLPLWREAILPVGHRQTRNRGTVGGSLCQLDPSAELPTVALAMDAELTAASVRGERRLRMADFFAGYMTPALEADEILTSIRVQPWPAGHGHAFRIRPPLRDFAIVSVAALVALDASGRLARVSLTLGGVAPRALHACGRSGADGQPRRRGRSGPGGAVVRRGRRDGRQPGARLVSPAPGLGAGAPRIGAGLGARLHSRRGPP